MQRKRQEYFAAGVRPVWIVDPTARTIDAHTAVDQRATLHEGKAP
jgi:Uma2 family endonuclease